MFYLEVDFDPKPFAAIEDFVMMWTKVKAEYFLIFTSRSLQSRFLRNK